MMSKLRQIRELSGVVLYDWPRYQRALSAPTRLGMSSPRGWISLCNRRERLSANPNGPGVLCEWQWGTELHACGVLPRLGRQLMQVALREWPIHFADQPGNSRRPRVSFIIAHGGRDRLPQLQRTIRSLYAQRDVSIECLVVDQSAESVIQELPSQTNCLHLAKNDVASGWHKAWAFNAGARAAKGDILIFHDGDICAPQQYAAEVIKAIDANGSDVVSLQRFLFYLDESSTTVVNQRDQIPSHLVPERVFQNWKGGTIAIRREAFFAIGGFDEGFVDWGGEDDEFFDRCEQSLRHCRFGFLPFVHLWHQTQADRRMSSNINISRIMPWRMELPASQRVQELTQRNFGNRAGPDPAISYKAAWDRSAR